MSISENIYEKNFFWKSFLVNKQISTPRKQTEKLAVKLSPQSATFQLKIWEELWDEEFFPKYFFFVKKNYWLYKTPACHFLPKSKNLWLKGRKKVTIFFLLKKTFTQNDYSGLIKSNFENQVLYFLPKNRKLISQSTKNFHEQNFFKFKTMSFTENVPRESGNFWSKI